MPRGERHFCRSVALTGEPEIAYQRAWPGRAARFTSSTIMLQITKLLEEARIVDGIDHYRTQIDGAEVRLEWNKMQRAQEAHKRAIRLGLGVREVRMPNDGGTDETVNKMKSDVIRKLRNAPTPRLLEAHVWAAKEIRSVLEARDRGLFGSRAMDGTHGGNKSRNERTPLEGMSSEERRAYNETFLPWKDEIDAELVEGPNSVKVGLYEITYGMVVNNFGSRQIEDMTGLRRGTVVPAVRKALTGYAVLAGWLKPAREENLQ